MLQLQHYSLARLVCLLVASSTTDAFSITPHTAATRLNPHSASQQQQKLQQHTLSPRNYPDFSLAAKARSEDEDDDDDDDREREFARVRRRRGGGRAYYDEAEEDDGYGGRDNDERRSSDASSSNTVGDYYEDEEDDDEDYYDDDDDDDDEYEDMEGDEYSMFGSAIIPNPLLDSIDPDGAAERFPELAKDPRFWFDMMVFVSVLDFLSYLGPRDNLPGIPYY